MFTIGDVKADNVALRCVYNYIDVDGNSLRASFSFKDNGKATRINFKGSYLESGKVKKVHMTEPILNKNKTNSTYAPNTLTIDGYYNAKKGINCPANIYLYHNAGKYEAYIVSKADEATALKVNGWTTIVPLSLQSDDKFAIQKACYYTTENNSMAIAVAYDVDGYVVDEKPIYDPSYTVSYSKTMLGENMFDLGGSKCPEKLYSSLYTLYHSKYDSEGKVLTGVLEFILKTDDIPEDAKNSIEKSLNSRTKAEDYKSITEVIAGSFCGNFSLKEAELTKTKDDYIATKTVENYNKYKSVKEKIVDYCSNVIKNGNYSDSCMKSCLDLDEKLAANESDMFGEGNSNDENRETCMLSSDMRNFLRNIFRWVRYLVPVLVVILGLFDFMRAAASGTEDHMKKAQKQLITRIIAAALIFLAPLVIGFFLEQFGFVAKECGII